jgi:hypothetical protein
LNGETIRLTREHKVTNKEEQQRLLEAGVEISDKATRLNGRKRDFF